MAVWFHTTILATSLAATVAVGLAAASTYIDGTARLAAKGDRLPVVAAADARYMTVETRSDGISVLSRVPVAN